MEGQEAIPSVQWSRCRSRSHLSFLWGVHNQDMSRSHLSVPWVHDQDTSRRGVPTLSTFRFYSFSSGPCTLSFLFRSCHWWQVLVRYNVIYITVWHIDDLDLTVTANPNSSHSFVSSLALRQISPSPSATDVSSRSHGHTHCLLSLAI